MDGLEPVVEPARPELADKDGPIRLNLQQLVHVFDRIVLEIGGHQN